MKAKKLPDHDVREVVMFQDFLADKLRMEQGQLGLEDFYRKYQQYMGLTDLELQQALRENAPKLHISEIGSIDESEWQDLEKQGYRGPELHYMGTGSYKIECARCHTPIFKSPAGNWLHSEQDITKICDQATPPWR